MDETNYEKSRTHVLHSNRASGRRPSVRNATWGQPMARRISVRGGVDNPRLFPSSSKWGITIINAAMVSQWVEDESKTQQGWAMAKIFMHGRL
jgi:hypothetical protein